MHSADLHMPITRTPRMKKGERVRYVPNHRSFGAFMKSDQMRDVTAEVASDISLAAEAAAPSQGVASKEHTGLHARVKAGFHVKRNAGLMKVGGNLRVKVEVVNPVPGAALVEFGAPGVFRQRMLGRAGARFGDFHGNETP
jgi:hypothetical protein